MYLINEEDTRDDLSTALFSPLSNFLVNLFTNFRFNFTNVTSEKSHETLGSRVDDIDFVKSDCVDNFLTLLELAFWALHEAGLRANIVEIRAARKRATQLGNFAASLVNCDDVACHNFLLGDGFNHLGTQVVDGLHLGCLEGDLASLGSAGDGLVDFNVNNLTFNDLSFFSDSHTLNKKSHG